MQAPNGVTIIFDGGSFSGALPSICEIKNSVAVVGTGSGVALTFQEGATLAAGSNLALNGGTVAATNATIAGTLALTYARVDATGTLTVSGSLESTGNKAFHAATLATSGAGSIILNVGAATGTTWTLATLEAASVEIDSLTASGDVDSAGIAEGTAWNIGGIFSAGGDVDVSALTTGGNVNLVGRADGSTWSIGGTLRVGSDASISTITQSGAVTIVGAASGSDWTCASVSAVDLDVDELTTTGYATATGDADGDDWTIGGALSVDGDATVDELTTTGAASIGDDAEGAAWIVGGNLTVGGAFNVPTLTLGGVSSVPLENVETLTLGVNAVLTISANSSITSLTTGAGSSMVFSQSFLAVEESASISSPLNVSGAGYFALPPGASYSNVAQAQGADVRVCEYGAGVSRLDGSVGLDGSTITGTPTKTNAAQTVLAEVKVDGVWTLANARASSTFTTQKQGTITEIRVFDGVSFVAASVYAQPPHVWLVYVNAAATQSVNPWKITTDFIMSSEYGYAGEPILLFARIVNSGTSAALTQADVSSIKYTCYKRAYTWGKETRTPVSGHSNVSIPTNAVLAALVTNDSRWTKDSIGYNFRFEPDATTSPIFPTPGDYIIVVTIAPTSGNPAPINYEVSVN